MKPVPIIPARLDWPSAIGSYLLSFGSLEYFVTVYLKDHLPKAEFEKAKEWHLVDRFERIAKLVRDVKQPQAEQDWVALVARVTPLRELRNHIAHGQLHLRRDSVSRKFKVVLSCSKDLDKAGEPGARELEFAELVRALTELASVNQEFERLAGFKPDGDVL